MKTALAIKLMIAQQACFAIETSVIHNITALSLTQLAWLRALGGLGLVVILAPSIGLRAIGRTPQFGLQVLRGLVSASYLLVMMYTLPAIPIADWTALSQTQALLIVLFGSLILGEQLNLQRAAAVFMGLAGAVILINPAFSTVTVIYLVLLVGGSLNSLAYVMNRYLQERDHPVTVMFYTSCIPWGCFTPSVVQQAWPAFELGFLAIIVIGPLGTYLGILAVRYADVSILAPYTYTRLLMIALIAPLVFNETLTLRVVVAALVIVAACVLSSMPTRSTVVRKGTSA